MMCWSHGTCVIDVAQCRTERNTCSTFIEQFTGAIYTVTSSVCDVPVVTSSVYYDVPVVTSSVYDVPIVTSSV